MIGETGPHLHVHLIPRYDDEKLEAMRVDASLGSAMGVFDLNRGVGARTLPAANDAEVQRVSTATKQLLAADPVSTVHNAILLAGEAKLRTILRAQLELRPPLTTGNRQQHCTSATTVVGLHESGQQRFTQQSPPRLFRFVSFSSCRRPALRLEPSYCHPWNPRHAA